ncbi:hypothetical protein BH18ACT15_BH18ACT15_00070 [soil metagenome]
MPATRAAGSLVICCLFLIGVATWLPTARAAGTAVDVAPTAGVAERVRTYSLDAMDSDTQASLGAISPAPRGQPWARPPDDALVVRHDPQAYPLVPLPQLFVSNGSTMSQPFSSWSSSDRHDCAWGDYDRDGYLDLFCAVGLDDSSTNELWHNSGNGTFVETSASQGFGNAATTHGRYRTASFVDANGDGWPDIYVTRFNAAEAGLFPSPADTYPNELWINRGSGLGFYLDTSLGLTSQASAQKDNDGCNQAFDYDDNGSQDVIMCGSAGFRLYKKSVGGSYSNVSKGAGVGGFWADGEWGDFNADGLADLVQVKGTIARIMEQTATHTFRSVWSSSLTGGLNLATGDVDGDGVLDIYVVATCTGKPASDRPDYIYYGSAANAGASVGAPLSFAVQQVPGLGSSSNGCGNTVEAIDYDRDARADFFVLNGHKTTPGPNQLWTVP